MTVKGNQGTLSGDICLAYEGATGDILTKRMSSHLQTFDKGHGRIEERNYWITSDIAWLQSDHQWPGLKSIGIAETKIEDLAGNFISKERRYFLLSFKNDIHRFAKAVRGHWGVESMHWTLDMSFGEDQSRIRKNHSPQNFSAMRKIALNLLKKTNLEFDGKIHKASIRGKRKAAGWDNAFLIKVLFSSKF
jgi:predicted transposase YbfD/YdcC